MSRPVNHVGRCDAGFTLLEVLVATVVVGLLLVGLSGGVRLGVQGWNQQARTVAATGDLGAVDAALRRLVAEADPGDRTRPAGLRGTATELRLTTTLPQAVSGQEADAALLVDGGTLVLRWRPHPPGLPLQPPPPPQSAELLRGVAGLQVAYWGPNGWQDSWDAADPPGLVRLTLRFPPGDPDQRHWPPLVAAPARARESR